MKTQKSKKKLSLLTIVFAIVLVGGFAYAAIAGTLYFTGRATLYEGGDVELQLVAEQTRVTTAAGSTGTLTLMEDAGKPNQKAAITAAFMDDLDLIEFEFQVKNTGTYPAKISQLSITKDEQILIEGTFTDLANVVVNPGETIPAGGSYTFGIKMNAAYGEFEPDEEFEFEARLDYEKAE